MRRQQSLEDTMERTNTRIHQALAADVSSPSGRLARRDRAVVVANALARLPEAYRSVVISRVIEERKFEDIAAEMNRSTAAVRMLLVRALEKLNVMLEGSA